MTATYTIELESTSGTSPTYADVSEDAVVSPYYPGPVMPNVIPESDAFFFRRLVASRRAGRGSRSRGRPFSDIRDC